MESSLKNKWIELILVVVVSAIITLALVIRTTQDTLPLDNAEDGLKYIQMTINPPFDFYVAPFSWRILIPYVAKILPFDMQSRYLLLCMVGLWLTGAAVYYLTKAYNTSQSLAWVGMLLYFSVGWATKFNAFGVFTLEPAVFLFTVLLIYCIYTKRTLAFFVLLTVGVLAKESVLFVVPLYYTLNARHIIDWKLAGKTILLALPAIAILLALRLAIAPLNGVPAYVSTLPEPLRSAYDVAPGQPYADYSFSNILRLVSEHRLSLWGRTTLSRYTVGTFGLLPLLALFALRRNIAVLIRFAPLIVLAFLQLFLALNQERLLVLAFPAFLLLAVNGIEFIAQTLKLSPATFIGLPLLLIVYLLINKDSSISLELLPNICIWVLGGYLAIMFSYAQFRNPSGFSGNDLQNIGTS